MIEGIGTISSKTASGNSTARSICQPCRNTTIPAIKNMSETRDKNNSAPKIPRINVHREKRIIARPQIEGEGVITERRALFCQRTYSENRGTKKPCEKFGSVHHCFDSLASTGA